MFLKYHLILFQLLCTCVFNDCSAKERHNVLFIAVDDLRPALGCYGDEVVVSPNIDGLASSGVLFERAYCQLAVCNPSRVSIMTGLRPDSTRVWDLVTQFRHTIPDAITIPQHFVKHGYHAVSYGKVFHNPWPDNASWSEPHSWPKKSSLWSKSSRLKLAKYREELKAQGRPQKRIDRLRPEATEIVDTPENQHIDGAIAEQALQALNRLSKDDKPFFLAVGFIRPHLPFVVPRKYWELYDRNAIPLAKNTSLPKNAPSFAMNTMYELRDYFDFHRTPMPNEGSLSEDQQRRLKHGYYASVSFIDSLIGRLLGTLDSLELADNTIVVLWGDHGWKLGEHNSWCKQTNYEIDTRVPLIIRAPDAKANSLKTDALVELVDVYPTLAELAELPVLPELEGQSVAPLLSDPNCPWKKAAISQFRRKVGDTQLMGYTLRTNRYRYVEWQDRRTQNVVATELYDHQTDPQENDNLSTDLSQKTLLSRLSQQLWNTLPEPPTLKNAPKGDASKSSPKHESERPTSQDSASTRHQPNIVVCVADDWSYPHASILGDPVVRTPNFDRIANEGTLFEHAFVSVPSCTPSRLSILTGQHHWRLKEGDSLGGSLREEFDVYTELLQDAGYKIGRFGKGVWPSKHEYRKRDSFGKKYSSIQQFLSKRKSNQPFCYWHGGQDPHRPYEYEIGKKSGMDLSTIHVPGCLPDNETIRSDIADYLWEVQRFDTQVGEIIRELKAADEIDNTIFVVTSDNGMPFPRCKSTLYDLGTRVPLAIRWGRQLNAPKTIRDFVSLCDLAPTFLEAAGLDIPQGMTGRSLLPLVDSKQSPMSVPDRTHVVTGMERHVYSYPSRSLRNNDFLYIRNFSPSDWPTGEVKGGSPKFDFKKTAWPTVPGAFSFNIDPSPSKQYLLFDRDKPAAKQFADLAFGKRAKQELYDLRSDPDQLYNVASQKKYATVLERLKQKLTAELIRTNDPRTRVKNYTSHNVEGWPVRISTTLRERNPDKTDRAIELLAKQLQKVKNVLRGDPLSHLTSVPIWLSPPYENARPTGEYHPNLGWLRKNGRPPELHRCIEFTNTAIFEKEIGRMPMMVLHELAHAYHDQVLGFDNAAIKMLFERSKNSGIYESIERYDGKIVQAYGMNNEREYFAESSEALFGTNDFFPFKSSELKQHDPSMHKLLCDLWNVSAMSIDD